MYAVMLALGYIGLWLAYRALATIPEWWKYAVMAGLCLVLATEAQPIGLLFVAGPVLVSTLALTRRSAARMLGLTYGAMTIGLVPRIVNNLSLGGLSAITQSPVGTGERVSVFFPPQGAQRGWDAYGRVLRCEPSGLGYRVAVEFDPLPAA